MRYVIRPVEPKDNPRLAEIVVATLTEFGCVGPGFASSDPELHRMYETYQGENKAYWVIEDTETGRVMGGGGYDRLKMTTEAEGICELQKLYFDPSLRGLGFGGRIVEMAICHAAKDGYREIYLETVHQMRSAVGLYTKFGFQPLETYKGDTGHRSCTVFMSRPLTAADAEPLADASPDVAGVSA